MFKRIQPRARGTAFQIKRRMAHIIVTLTDAEDLTDGVDAADRVARAGSRSDCAQVESRPRRRHEVEDNTSTRGSAVRRSPSCLTGHDRRYGSDRPRVATEGTPWVRKSDRPASARASCVPGAARGTPTRTTSPSCSLEDTKIRGVHPEVPDEQARPQGAAAGHRRHQIERTRERVTVVVTSSRVGAIIGKKGEKIDKLTKALEKLTRRHIEVKTIEVTRPEIDAAADRRGHRGAAGEAGQLPPDHEAGHAAGDGGRREGREAATLRPARRVGNGPLREGDGRVASRSRPFAARSSTGSPRPRTPQGNIGIKAWVNQGDYLTGDIADATDASGAPRRGVGHGDGPGGGGGPR